MDDGAPRASFAIASLSRDSEMDGCSGSAVPIRLGSSPCNTQRPVPSLDLTSSLHFARAVCCGEYQVIPTTQNGASQPASLSLRSSAFDATRLGLDTDLPNRFYLAQPETYLCFA